MAARAVTLRWRVLPTPAHLLARQALLSNVRRNGGGRRSSKTRAPLASVTAAPRYCDIGRAPTAARPVPQRSLDEGGLAWRAGHVQGAAPVAEGAPQRILHYSRARRSRTSQPRRCAAATATPL